MLNITPFTEQDYVEHLKTGTEVCMVCGEPLRGLWTDYNGQMKCSACGMTHQILGSHHTQEFLDKHDLTKEDVAQQYCDDYLLVPLYRRYWEEKHIRLPLGMFISDRNAPTQHEQVSYISWLMQHKEDIETVYPDIFAWDRMSAYVEAHDA